MIAEITSNTLDEALALVNRVFAEFVAVDYSDKGKETFAKYLAHKTEEVSADLLSGHKKLWGYYQDGIIAGVTGIRNGSHIALLFVDKAFHKQGIARKLFEAAVAYMRDTLGVKKITVNSSPYAVPVYKRLGFTATAGQQETDGILYIPMKKVL